MLPVTPLLADDSPLDERSRALIAHLYAEEMAKAKVLPSDHPLDPKRRRRVELTRQELWEQPEVLQKTLALERDTIRETAVLLARTRWQRIYLVGCGDSLACMIGIRALYEQLLHIPCEPIQALDFTYYYSRLLTPETLVIGLSSSGVTTRTVEAILLAKSLGSPTLALTNTPGSTLMQEAEGSLCIHAQRRGWPTQASTAAMATLVQWGLDVARAQGNRDVDPWQDALDAIPEQMAAVLAQLDSSMAEIAQREVDRQFFLFAAAGPAYASALFGSAKVKECTPNHALAIPLEEYHHYNSQKAGDPLFLIVPPGPSRSRSLDTAEEGRRWGGQIYALVDEQDQGWDERVDVRLPLPRIREELSALLYTLPLQQFAYHVAMAKFQQAENNP